MMSRAQHLYLESWVTEYGGTAVLGFISTMLILGKIFHHVFQFRGLLFGLLVVPPVIISGLFGLLFFFIFLQIDEKIAIDLENGLDATKINLINFVFASLILGLTCSRKNSQHNSIRALITSILHEGLPMIIYGEIITWGQSGCCLIVLFFCNNILNMKIPHQFATIVPLGIESGQASLFLFHSSHDTITTSESEPQSMGAFRKIISVTGGTTNVVNAMSNSNSYSGGTTTSYPEWSKTIVQESQTLGLLAACLLAIIVMSGKQLFISYGWIQQETSRPSRTFRGVHSVGEAETFDRRSKHGNGTDNSNTNNSNSSNNQHSSRFHRSFSTQDIIHHHNTSVDLSNNFPVEPTSSYNDINRKIQKYAVDDFASTSISMSSPYKAKQSNKSFAMNANNTYDDNYDDYDGGNITNTGNSSINNNASSLIQASLGSHISMIALAVFLSFGISLCSHTLELYLNWNRYFLSGVPLFKLSMVCALICMQFALTQTSIRFKREWFMRLCGLMLDLLLICALSSSCPKIQSLEATHYLLCSLFVMICIAWNIFCFLYIAKEIFPNYWFTRAITISGGVLGHSYMGLLLARTLDPYLLSPVPVAYAYKLMLFIIPSTSVKNSIIIKLVDDYNLSVGVIVAWLVVITWYLIYYHHFKHRFVSSSSAAASKKIDGVYDDSSQIKNKHDDDDDNNNEYALFINHNNSHINNSTSSISSKEHPTRRRDVSPSNTIRTQQPQILLSSTTGLELDDDDDEEGFEDDHITENNSKSKSRSSKGNSSLVQQQLYSQEQSISQQSLLKFVHESSESSSIVSPEQLHKIWCLLPATYSDKSWSLKYSLRRDGASLETLLSLCVNKDIYGYKLSSKNSPNPYRLASLSSSAQNNNNFSAASVHTPSMITGSSVIVIEDSWGYIFGGFLAHPWEDRPNYYGNGESFVYSLVPHCQSYPWTRANSFFVLSNATTLAMGGGNGGFSFQLDDELDTGVSNKSATYDNAPLSSSEFFKCINVEVWSIDSMVDVA